LSQQRQQNTLHCISSKFDFFDKDDYLVVYDGNSTNSRKLGEYTGKVLPPTIQSTGGSLTVAFHNYVRKIYGMADYAAFSASTGFYALFLATGPGNSAPGKVTLRASFGTFNDGSGTGQYRNSASSMWQIRPSSHVWLQFASFDLEDGKDFVHVYDGDPSSATLIGSYTGMF
jgi:hypothetical protein